LRKEDCSAENGSQGIITMNPWKLFGQKYTDFLIQEKEKF
jgi:hypothetical protein